MIINNIIIILVHLWITCIESKVHVFKTVKVSPPFPLFVNQVLDINFYIYKIKNKRMITQPSIIIIARRICDEGTESKKIL